MNRLRLCRQYKKSLLEVKKLNFKQRTDFAFQVESVLFWSDTVIVVEVDVSGNEEVRSSLPESFTLWIHSVLRIKKKFSAKALSYGFPGLDIDGVMPLGLFPIYLCVLISS